MIYRQALKVPSSIAIAVFLAGSAPQDFAPARDVENIVFEPVAAHQPISGPVIFYVRNKSKVNEEGFGIGLEAFHHNSRNYDWPTGFGHDLTNIFSVDQLDHGYRMFNLKPGQRQKIVWWPQSHPRAFKPKLGVTYRFELYEADSDYSKECVSSKFRFRRGRSSSIKPSSELEKS